jgi:hypothetical protein
MRGQKSGLRPFNPTLEQTNKWQMHIKDVYRIHRNEIDKLDSLDQKTA